MKIYNDKTKETVINRQYKLSKDPYSPKAEPATSTKWSAELGFNYEVEDWSFTYSFESAKGTKVKGDWD